MYGLLIFITKFTILFLKILLVKFTNLYYLVLKLFITHFLTWNEINFISHNILYQIYHLVLISNEFSYFEHQSVNQT